MLFICLNYFCRRAIFVSEISEFLAPLKYYTSEKIMWTFYVTYLVTIFGLGIWKYTHTQVNSQLELFYNFKIYMTGLLFESDKTK